MSDQEAEFLYYDLRGQICPSTLLTALREVNRYKGPLRAGGLTLSFQTDNRDSTTTIPDAVRNMGYHVAVTKEKGHYCIVIGKQH
ncbi:MAG: sulfurtransferase TusA family protein [Desulfuromonas sp.]|uniref:sulfurtransferase TusA family protein n=1 Tax=Desulfuromonas sp. TaxID=892 RepID=UPI000CA9A51A|nr:sulfurtransferase TusA family protein [Desulfuromonas sp.]PLX85620.1 MAG: sulfurtransferase TusA family protein [Desulfuromonas sp.]